MNSWIRQVYKGVSWRNPLINGVFRLVDIPDAIIRGGKSLSFLPPYSIRVRSRGMANQFGGTLFRSQGQYMVSLLEAHGELRPEWDVAEVGCGCGCAAAALVDTLTEGGSYFGFDIDKKSIDFCNSSARFSRAGFKFEVADVFNSQYNPEGKLRPEDFVFPIEPTSKDLVFLTSVFTHMLPDSVDKYLSEIARVLKPGGQVVMTVFLMDHGHTGKSINFPYEIENCRLHQTTFPERGVGYQLETLQLMAEKYGLVASKKPVLGNWRTVSADGEEKEESFGQDILVFKKT